ncbi:MAG: zf-HC2 domain-containing protein [Actinobacteria bacterium]|nr:zf-HC2 domain-containing protein [Actinomycetota bacterium]
MTHPLEQLACAVDGTLASADRAALDDHLRSCAACRAELEVATTARRSLAALPAPEAPDLAAGFTADRIASLTSATPASRSPWSRLMPALAAAAVVALVAVAVPRLGSSSDEAPGAADHRAGVEAATVAEGPVRIQIDDTDYDVAAIEQLAAETTASLTAEAAEAGAPAEAGTEAPIATSGPTEHRFAPGRTRTAVACLRQAFSDYPGEIVQVRQAMFEGTPAFLGIVLERPQDGGPATLLSIWVTAIADCSILSLGSASL